MPLHIAVAGSVNADLVLSLTRVPSKGETLAARHLAWGPGGKVRRRRRCRRRSRLAGLPPPPAPPPARAFLQGGNQAAAAARLGCPTKLVAQVGQDAQAGMLRQSLQDYGVDTSLVRDVEGPTGTAVILLEADGENRIIIHGGANTAPWQLTDGAIAAIRGAGAVLLQREIPEEVNTQVAQLAHAGGVPVVLDAGGATDPISPDLLRCLAVLSPNETELQGLTGMPTESEEEIVAAARTLQAQGVGTVLVKLGSRGSLLVGGKSEVVRQEAQKVDKVVDTTGAGDCFTAAFAVGLLEGQGHQECMRFASAAAALCIKVAGAMPSMPSRQAVDAELAGGSA